MNLSDILDICVVREQRSTDSSLEEAVTPLLLLLLLALALAAGLALALLLGAAVAAGLGAAALATSAAGLAVRLTVVGLAGSVAGHLYSMRRLFLQMLPGLKLMNAGCGRRGFNDDPCNPRTEKADLDNPSPRYRNKRAPQESLCPSF